MFMVYFSWQRAMQFELFLSRRRKRAHTIQDAMPGSQEIMTLFKTLKRKIIYPV